MADFQHIIKTIQGRGHSLGWMSQQLGVSVTTLSMIKNTPGRQPRYNLGQSLVELEMRTRK